MINNSASPAVDVYDRNAKYNIGDLPVSNQKILDTIKESVPNQIYNPTLRGLFTYLPKARIYQYTQDPNLEAELRFIHEAKFYSQLGEQDRSMANLLVTEKQKLYPLNKVITLGRVAERVCIITRDNVFVQVDQKTQARKPLNVVDVDLEIQPYSNKLKHKIEWIKDSANFKFRLVLTDSKKDLKAVYFQTEEEAAEVRDYCLCRLRLRPEAIDAVSYHAQAFKNRMLIDFSDKYISQLDVVSAKRNPDRSVGANMNVQQPNNMQSSINNNMNQSMGVSRIEPAPNPPLYESRANTVSNQNNQIPNTPNNTNRMQMSNVSNGIVDSRVVPASPYGQLGNQEAEMKNINTSNIRSPSQSYNKPSAFQNNTSNTMVNQRKPSQTANTIQPLSAQSIVGNRYSITFDKVQFLDSFIKSGELIKPTLFISVRRFQNIVMETRLETYILKKDPTSIYALVAQHPYVKQYEASDNINALELSIRVLNRANGQFSAEKIVRFKLRDRMNSQELMVSTDGQDVRLHIKYANLSSGASLLKSNPSASESLLAPARVNTQEGLITRFPKLDGKIVDLIRSYWRELGTRTGYYSPDIELEITDILSRVEIVPKHWWISLNQEQYQVLSLLEAASKIIGFKVIEAYLPIIRAFFKIHMFANRPVDRVFTEVLVLVSQFLQPFYSQNQMNTLQRLHRIVGVEFDCNYASRVGLELSLLRKIIEIECSKLDSKLQGRNIHLGLLLYEYMYELFSRNFNLKVLTTLWNFMIKEDQPSQQPMLFQEYLFLLCVVLVKLNEKELMATKQLSLIKEIFEEKNHKSAEDIDAILVMLRHMHSKYFTKPETLLKEITKQLFSDNYFEGVVAEFVKSQRTKTEYQTSKKVAEKKEILTKLMEIKKEVILPSYQPRTYSLHIYLHKLPETSGVLLFKSGPSEHECSVEEEIRYYVIQNVSQPLEIGFVTQGKKWSGTAQLVLGITHQTLKLKQIQGLSLDMEIQYTAGLLTEAQEMVIRKNKPIDQFLSSYMKYEHICSEFSKSLNNASILQSKTIPREIVQAIKVLFSGGSNVFDDLDFYLSWIACLREPLTDKLYKVKDYCRRVEAEHFLCTDTNLIKLLLYRFIIKTLEFPITDSQFEFYYNSSSNHPYFHSPRIIKCRYVLLSNNSMIKLEKEAHRYISTRGCQEFESDIILTETSFFADVIYRGLQSQNISHQSGNLIIQYSSEGKIKEIVLPLRFSRDTKLYTVNIQSEIYEASQFSIGKTQPEILSTQSFPTFTKITRIFQKEKPTTSRLLQEIDKRKDPPREHTNLLKQAQSKLRCVLFMRYLSHPASVKIPFLGYFCELLHPIEYPNLPRMVFKGGLCDLKTISTYKGELEISDNQIGENFVFDKSQGLYGSFLRNDLQKCEIIYVWPVNKQNTIPVRCSVFVNHGFGIFSWEQCILKGYVKGRSNNGNNRFYVLQLNNKGKIQSLTYFFPNRCVEIMAIRDDLRGLYTDVLPELSPDETEQRKAQLLRIQGKSEIQREMDVIERKKFLNFIKKG